MASRAMLTLYTILIVVLVLILFLFVLALILFRESLEACCCPGFRRRRPLLRAAGRELPGGLGNPGFDEQDRPRRMPEQRPFDPMEAVESPPSYEEAVKQELFRFRPSPSTQTDRSYTPTEGSIPEEDNSQATNSHEDGASACAAAQPPHSLPSLPSTSHSCTEGYICTQSSFSHSCGQSSTSHSCTGGHSCTESSTSHSCTQSSTIHSCGQSSRKRGSSVGASSHSLSTIREEDHEEWPVTVVIDCIGVQASRLLENCETSVSLTNGSELGAQSKC